MSINVMDEQIQMLKQIIKDSIEFYHPVKWWVFDLIFLMFENEKSCFVPAIMEAETTEYFLNFFFLSTILPVNNGK